MYAMLVLFNELSIIITKTVNKNVQFHKYEYNSHTWKRLTKKHT